MSPLRAVRGAPWRILVAISLVLSALLIVSPAGAVTVGGGILGGFEQDGNQDFPEAPPTAGTLDWQSLAAAGPPPVVVPDDTFDSGFTGGSKELKPSEWECGIGGATPDKGNILRAYLNPRVTSDQLFLDLAWIREGVSGDGSVNLAFEFNQNTADQIDEPTEQEFIDGVDCPLVREDGDLLVTYDFGGSAHPDITIMLFKWDSSLADSNQEGAWVDLNLSASDAKAAVNVDPTDMIDPITDYIVGGTIDDLRFGEATINLSAALNGNGDCVSFGLVNIRSRASGGSDNAALQDRLPATVSDLSTCGSIKIVKFDDSDNLLGGATFQVWADDGDGVFDDTLDTFVDDCTTEVDDTSTDFGTCEVGSLNPGDYFVLESAAPTGYTADPDVVGPITVGLLEQVVIDGTTDVDGDGLDDRFVNIRTQYRLTISPDDTNLVNNDHTFTALLEISTDGGTTFNPVAGQTLTFELAGVGTVVDVAPDGLTPDQCVTAAAPAEDVGECTITINSLVTGLSTVTVTFEEEGVTVTEPIELSADADKLWVNYQLTVEPDDVNRVGEAHTFTVTLERDEGSGFAAVGAGEVIDLTWSGAADDVTSVVPDNPATLALDCLTDIAGQCLVTVQSDVTGTETLSATFGAVVGDTSATFGPEDATKRWIDWAMLIQPLTDENLVDNNHVFSVTVFFDAGDGVGPVPLQGVNPVVALSGVGSIVNDGCADPGTDVHGECLVTITSATPGLSTLTATLDVADSGVTATLTAGPANKLWVDFELTVNPPTAENPTGTTHEFTITLKRDAGQGLVGDPGEEVDLALTGVGSILEVNGVAVVGNVQSCTTNAAGQCTVLITSNDAGTSILTATFDAVVSNTSATFTDSGEKIFKEPERPRYGDEPLDEEFDHPHNDYDYGGDTDGVHNPHDDASSNAGDPGTPAAGNSDSQAPSTQTAGNPLDLLADSLAQPASSPALEAAGTPAASGGELPRTGGWLRDETFLGLILLITGMMARGARRRRCPQSA